MKRDGDGMTGGAPLRPDDEARLALHWAMLRVRRVEEAIQRRYAEQRMRCPTHLCLGQEAVPVGVSAHLRREDPVFSGHRSHGHYLAKGGDLGAMIAELYGRETGCAKGRGGSQHLIDLDAGFVASAPILAGTVSVAVGAALGARMQGRDLVSVIFVGDGATEEGAFHESLNFAAVKRLPVLFVCENNLYSVHSAMDVRQPEGRSVARIADGHGMRGERADGNEIETVWRVAGEALGRIRSGGGPELLEFMTYRWVEHCGPADDIGLGYRSAEELAAWKERCPVRLSEAALRREALASDVAFEAREAEIAAEIEQAFAFAEASPFPAPETFGQDVYPCGQGG